MKKNQKTVACRLCGAPIAVVGKTVLVCRECGAKSIIPAEADDETLNLYTDAFRYLCHNDFYSAIRLFEALLKREDCCAAHAGLMLGRYGVTGEREPITGVVRQICKRRITDDLSADPDRSAAVARALPDERKAIAEYAELIAAEQARLLEEERENARKEREAEAARGGLSSEFDEASRRAKEKAEREEREKEAERLAIAEQEAKRAEQRERVIDAAKRRERNRKLLRVALPAVSAVVALLVVTFAVILPAAKYKKAVAAYNAEDYCVAATLFRSLGEYKSSEGYLRTICFYGLNEGDTVTFGRYTQNNAIVQNPIVWVVLENDGETCLLISRYALDVHRYNEKHTPVTWATCDLRTWLNEDFYASAFNVTEQKMIWLSSLTTADNTTYHTDGGEDTEDRVFILSAEEAKRYLSGKDYGVGVGTTYTRSQNLYEDESGNGACWTWLRTPGSSQSNAAKTNYDSTVNENGAMVDFSGYGVRPCIRVRVERFGTLID